MSPAATVCFGEPLLLLLVAIGVAVGERLLYDVFGVLFVACIDRYILRTACCLVFLCMYRLALPLSIAKNICVFVIGVLTANMLVGRDRVFLARQDLERRAFGVNMPVLE